MEFLDVFDEQGNPTGEVIARNQVHMRKTWHKSVHAYLINNKKQILLQLRSKDKDIYPDVWDISMGGHISAGEDSLTTLYRELEEELGVFIKPVDAKYVFTNKEILQTGSYISAEFVDIYLVNKDVCEKDIKLQKEEVGDFKFVSLFDFVKMIEHRDEKLFPHWEEYEKILPVLKKEYKL